MSSDNLITGSAPANGKWEFDASVAAVFDDMLERSIPNYKDLRSITTSAALSLASNTPTPLIVDLGASRGAALAPIVERRRGEAKYLATDVSEPMLAACKDRFAEEIEAGFLSVENTDLRLGLPALSDAPSVFILSLTLQFVPIEYRQGILRSIYHSLRPGGGLILTEKVLGSAAESNELLVDLYYGLKIENGYSDEAIERKRLSLEGVLVPLTAQINEEWLRTAGFELVECIWAWANFRAWVAIKRDDPAWVDPNQLAMEVAA